MNNPTRMKHQLKKSTGDPGRWGSPEKQQDAAASRTDGTTGGMQ